MRSKSTPRYSRGVVLQQFARPFVERGGKIQPVLHRNGIPDTALRDPKRLVEASAFYAALDDMADALKDPYFGATVARNAAFEGVPSLRATASAAATLGDFLIGAILKVDLQFDNVVYDLRVSPGAAVFQVQRTRTEGDSYAIKPTCWCTAFSALPTSGNASILRAQRMSGSWQPHCG